MRYKTEVSFKIHNQLWKLKKYKYLKSNHKT